MQVAQLLPEERDELPTFISTWPSPGGARRGVNIMLRKIPILLALAVVTIASVSGCARCRRWCQRGSPCVGTRIAAPAVMAAPVAVSTPAPPPRVVPAPAPVVAPAPVQQVIVPQPQQVVVPQPIYCCPQPVPCCPQPVPCCPQPVHCCPPVVCDPCPAACSPGCVDGYVEGDCGPVTSFDEGYLVPGTETPLDSDDSDADPGPAREN